MMIPVQLSTAQAASLIVVVDTEEEFDWSNGFDRDCTAVGHLRRIGDLQALFEAHGIRPVYAVDYPVVSQSVGVDALGPIVAGGGALVAAHLHPWVSPPFGEELSARNSYPGNLPRPQEAEKLRVLKAAIERAFAAPPVIYKAGRHGIGVNSFAVIEELGFQVDLSPSPPFDCSPDGGPDFSGTRLQPTWVGPTGKVLSIPGTGAFLGHLPSRTLYRWLTAPALAPLRLPGLASRLRIVERVRLSPEGHSLDEMCRLTRRLHRSGTRLFVLSLHSPSIEPGHTPFVRSETERRTLFERLDRYFTFFRKEIGGVPTDPLAVRLLLGPRRIGVAA